MLQRARFERAYLATVSASPGRNQERPDEICENLAVKPFAGDDAGTSPHDTHGTQGEPDPIRERPP
jgi:hypothetical protein